ncbi:hypothetical protein PG623_10510 [Riemerella anatipestifer]|nr:hypothetical protein [Riemerella anatipestifer]
MRNYDLEIENAEKFKVLNITEIYDYRDTPFEELISQYYEFCKVNLDIQSKHINILPNVFIFNSYLSSNAIAKRSENAYSISINLGLLKRCNDNFLENDKLDEYLDLHYGVLLRNLDNKISGLGYQIATSFTYYHELAHLFQFEKKNESLALYENVTISSKYSLIKHYLEINADSFASIALTSHISQYLEKSYGENLNQEITEDIFKILGACLLNHIVNFYPDISSIYLREHSHPHPYLRILNSIISLTHYLNQSEILSEKNINIDSKKLTKEIIEFYEELESQNIFESDFRTAMTNASSQLKEIIEYLGQLVEFNISDYNNALELWNRHIT